ncbi:MAG TPA: dihydroorotase [Gaiellales bacterium]|jgi:dihydroorotase
MPDRLHLADSAPASAVIAGGRLIDPTAGFHGQAVDIRIEGGRIAEIGTGLAHPDAETIDATGLTITPGLVDPHVHLRTPGDEDEEDIASGTRAAAAGGFVAILAMPNTSPVVDSAAVLTGLIDQARSDAVIATGFLCAITRGQQGRGLSEMGELASAGAAAFSDDGRPVADAGILRRALQYSSVTGLKLALHEEDTSLSAGGQMHEGAVSAELGLHGWPAVAESTMIARDLGLARHEGAPLHICHVSVADSVAEIRRARELGGQVSAEVTPHHLCLTDEAVRDLDPAATKMNPPLGSAADRAALIDAVADGTLDCIATDHAPHRDHEKDAPFEEAPFGVIGLETAFAAIYTHLVEPGLLPLQTVIERMSAGPAAAFGLPVPMLAVGRPADLVLWDLAATRRVEPPYASRSSNCAFAGQTLRGVCRLTVCRGRIAHRLIEAVA